MVGVGASADIYGLVGLLIPPATHPTIIFVIFSTSRAATQIILHSALAKAAIHCLLIHSNCDAQIPRQVV